MAPTIASSARASELLTGEEGAERDVGDHAPPDRILQELVEFHHGSGVRLIMGIGQARPDRVPVRGEAHLAGGAQLHPVAGR